MNKFWFSVLRQESFAEEDEKITDSVGIIFYNYGDDDRDGRLWSKCVSAIIYFAQCYYYVFLYSKNTMELIIEHRSEHRPALVDDYSLSLYDFQIGAYSCMMLTNYLKHNYSECSIIV